MNYSRAKENILSAVVSSRINHMKKRRFCSLSKEQCAILITSPCVYCGEQPKPKEKNFNTIDRLNNDNEYTPDNCVTACYNCNSAKNNLSLEDFLVWIKRIKTFNNCLEFTL